jgi:glycosyltransferase involved in cell wall biosynthesis
MLKLSIIIPCYNELKNLPLLLKRCETVFDSSKNIEIIIVDNGSTDGTSLALDKLITGLSFIKKVNVEINQGYGYGILAGLKAASGDILCWTHADMQTDIADTLKGMIFFSNESEKNRLFLKGRRSGRPVIDMIFTVGMSVFETLLLRKPMWDINAQPTMFHRDFYLSWSSPPNDFSLDLYVYYLAKKSNLTVKRFPVVFAKRAFGVSNWNINFSSKYAFIKRTLIYSFSLSRRIK